MGVLIYTKDTNSSACKWIIHIFILHIRREFSLQLSSCVSVLNDERSIQEKNFIYIFCLQIWRIGGKSNRLRGVFFLIYISVSLPILPTHNPMWFIVLIPIFERALGRECSICLTNLQQLWLFPGPVQLHNPKKSWNCFKVLQMELHSHSRALRSTFGDQIQSASLSY